MAKERIFIDTNIIIESFRVSCWTAIAGRFSIETVVQCIKETIPNHSIASNYTVVPSDILSQGLAQQHRVSLPMLVQLVCADADSEALDIGEKYLLAWLLSHKSLLTSFSRNKIATADKAALRACYRLGWLDCVISLEEMAVKAGQKAKLNELKNQYKQNWLSRIKTDIKLGVL